MQKKCLLALLALNALAPKVLAQDDDAELGTIQNETPVMGGSSIAEDSEPMPAPAAASALTQQAKPTSSNTLVQTQQPATPPPSTSTTSSSTATAASEEGYLDGRRRPSQTFGVTISRPDSIGDYNHYEYLYGSARVSPGFYGGYYLYSNYVDLGWVGRISYYHDEGHPLASREGLELPFKGKLTDQPKDDNQKLALTLIPVQFSGEAAIAPFKTRWLVLRAWVGMEFLYISESVSLDDPESTTPSDNASTYTVSGWNRGVATGFMASFSLDWL